MKATFNPFHLVAGMAADVSAEIADLEREIDDKNVDAVRSMYRHIDSLLTGIDYTVGYVLEPEIRSELEGTVKDLRDRLEACRIDAMQLSWSDRLGAVVRISSVVDVHGAMDCTAEIVGKAELHAPDFARLAKQLREYQKEATA